jgi:Tol biopolymer transport system component
LFIAQSDGSGMKQLAGMSEYEYHGSPRWSPDGKFLAFNVWKRGETDRNGRIAVMHSDGSNARILVDGLMPSFSPDGKWIAFTRHQPHPGIWVVNVEGAKQELMQIDAAGWGVDWSSGDKLAYPILRDDQANLAVYDMSKRRRELLWAADPCPYTRIFRSLAWSPDGKQIAFKGLTTAGQPELAIIDARGAKQGLSHRLQEDIQPGFAWTNKDQILFCKACPDRQGRSQIYSLAADGNVGPQLLPGQDPNRSFGDVALSADGKQLVLMGFLQSPAQIRAVRADIAP